MVNGIVITQDCHINTREITTIQDAIMSASICLHKRHQRWLTMHEGLGGLAYVNHHPL